MNIEQIRNDLEKAATSLLTDDEILISLNLSQEQLDANYDIVERSRVRLKQHLNARRITEAANNGSTFEIVETIPRNKSRRGGYRPNSGRPAGSITKLSAANILASIEKYTGECFEDLLAQGYRESIENNDITTRLKYETLFLSKVVADKVDITSLGQSIAPTILLDHREIDE